MQTQVQLGVDMFCWHLSAPVQEHAEQYVKLRSSLVTASGHLELVGAQRHLLSHASQHNKVWFPHVLLCLHHGRFK